MIPSSERRYADPHSSAKATHPEADEIDCGASRTPGAGMLCRRWSGVAVLALGGLEDAGAALVGALVGLHLLGALVVALGEHGLDLGGGELVVAGPRLVAAQCGDPAQDRGAVLVAALVGVDLCQVDLRELSQPAGDLLGGPGVVAGDRE